MFIGWHWSKKKKCEIYEKMLTQLKILTQKLYREDPVKEEQSHAETIDEIVDLLNKVSDWVESARFKYHQEINY